MRKTIITIAPDEKPGTHTRHETRHEGGDILTLITAPNFPTAKDLYFDILAEEALDRVEAEMEGNGK